MPKKPKIPGPKPPNGPQMPKLNGVKKPAKPQRQQWQLPEGMPDLGMMEGGDPMGMGLAGNEEERIGAWLEGMFEKNIPGMSLRLLQMGPGGGTTCNEWSGEEIEDKDPASLASSIYAVASDDASNMEVPLVRYSIECIRGTDAKRVSRIAFSIRSEEPEGGYGAEDGSTVAGHMSQAHRHAETYARMMVAQTSDVMRNSREMGALLSAERAARHRERVQTIELYEQMKDRKMMREITTAKHLRSEKLKNMAVGFVLDQAMKFAPELAARMGLVTAEEREALTNHDALMNWLMAMPETEAKKLLDETKDPGQRDALTKAYMAAKAKRAKMEAKKALLGDDKKQLNGNANGAVVAGAAVAGAAAGAAANTAGPSFKMAAASSAEAGEVQTDSTKIELNKQEMAAVNVTTLLLIGSLVDLNDAFFNMALGEVPESAREDLEHLRKEIKDGFSPNEQQKTEIATRFRADVVELLVTMDDMKFNMLAGQLKEQVRELATKTRSMLKKKLS